MADRWTNEQTAAIEHRHGNLLLSAAAGSGKTAVLVARVIGLITDRDCPVDVDRLLVVTFTEAAAREMRHRIGRALSDLIVRQGEDELLERQLALVARAQISTIHSFCLTVLRRYAFELGLDPTFTVLDSLEATVMLADALERVVDNRLKRPQFADLVRCYGRDLNPALEDLFYLSRTHPQPEQWLTGVEEMFDLPEGIDGLPWTELLLSSAGRELVRARDKLIRAWRLTQLPDGPEMYGERLSAELEMIGQFQTACKNNDWGSFQRLVQTCNFGRLPGAKDVDAKLADQAKQLRAEAKKIIGKLCPLALSSDQDLLADLQLTGMRVQELVAAVRAVGQQYEVMKQRQGRVDFSDLELGCYQLLSSENGNSEPVKMLRQQYQYVLVDEFQDINPLQDAIINVISGDGKLFAVGDVRQSIFGFRLAEPQVFMRRIDEYERGGSGSALRLNHNFRSRPEIIDNINFLFKQSGWEQGSDLVAAADYPPSPGESGQGRPVDVIVLDKQAGAGDDMGTELSNLEREAVLAGREIRGILAGSFLVWDDQERDYRSARPGDIAVLLRATKWKSEVVVSVLERMGIPAYANAQTGLLDAPEASTLLSLLRIVDNPRQDIHLASTLHTVGRFSYEEITTIRQNNNRGDLYDALRSVSSEDNRVRSFIEDLQRWREMAQRMAVSDLIWTLLRDTGYYDYVGGLPGGKARRANLRAICDWASSFQAAGTSLAKFLEHVDRVADRGVDLGAAPVSGEGDNVVRVMSVHASKGLEFPVVIMLDMGREIEAGSRSRDILVHRRLGVGATVVRMEDNVVYPSLALAAVKRALSEDGRQEELRVLYVGLTRARERLIMIGSVRDAEQSIQAWRQEGSAGDLMLRPATVLGAKTYLDLIMPAIVRHHSGCIGEYPCVKAPEQVADARGCWSVSVVEWTAEWTSGAGDRAAPDECDKDVSADLVQRLEWKPGKKGWEGLAAKVAATELKRRYEPGHEDGAVWSRIEGRSLWPLPEVMRGDEPLPHERGLALHRFLQHVDLGGAVDECGLNSQLLRMVGEGILAEAMAAAVDVEDVARLFCSDLGRELIARRDRVRREVPFTLAVPPERIYREVAVGGPSIVVQGVIDCIISDEDGLTVIDFKLSPPDRHRRTREEAYADQLAVYCTAAAAAYRKPVKRSCVVYVSSGEVVWLSPAVAATD